MQHGSWLYNAPALCDRLATELATLIPAAVVVGKDAVPRATVSNLSRLMDEMVTALARCKQPKLKVGRVGRRPSVAPCFGSVSLEWGTKHSCKARLFHVAACSVPQVLPFPWWGHRKEQFRDLFWR